MYNCKVKEPLHNAPAIFVYLKCSSGLQYWTVQNCTASLSLCVFWYSIYLKISHMQNPLLFSIHIQRKRYRKQPKMKNCERWKTDKHTQACRCLQQYHNHTISTFKLKYKLSCRLIIQHHVLVVYSSAFLYWMCLKCICMLWFRW